MKGSSMCAKLSVPLVFLTLILLSSCKNSSEGKTPLGAVPSDSRRGVEKGPIFECDWDHPGSLAADISTGKARIS